MPFFYNLKIIKNRGIWWARWWYVHSLQENSIFSLGFLNFSVPRNISFDEYSLIQSSINWWIYVVVYSSVTSVTDVFKNFVPARYFSLPTRRTVHIHFDSVFCSAPLPPLIPMSPPAPTRPPHLHHRHQPAPSSVDRHRPSHRPAPRQPRARCRCPHPWSPLARPHGRRLRQRPRPTQPQRLPPRKPPPPAPGTSNLILVNFRQV
jgi:hypothetical protein